jgi:hypothetical protein
MIVALLLLTFQDDEAARAKVAEFNKAKSKDLKAALEELGTLQHPRILKELAGHLKGQPDDIKVVAAKLIGKYKGNKDAAEALILVLGAEAARAKKSEAGDDVDHLVAATILNALADIAHKESAPKIHSQIDHVNTELVKCAVVALGEMGHVESVDPLIRLLSEVQRGKQLAEAPRTNTVKPAPASTPGMMKLPGRSGNPPPKEEKDMKEAIFRCNALEPHLQSAIQKLTGDFEERTGKAWSDWWAKNKKKK